jgi:DNA-binding NarL/FixJ family response regulator
MGKARVSKGRIRVLLADREGIFRLGLKKLFAVEDDLRVVGEAENPAEVLKWTETFRPHLVFIHEGILAEGGSNVIPAVRGLLIPA